MSDVRPHTSVELRCGIIRTNSSLSADELSLPVCGGLYCTKTLVEIVFMSLVSPVLKII